MKSLIIKYSLDTNEYMDNRNIEEAINEIPKSNPFWENMMQVTLKERLLRGKVHKIGNHLYALQKSAIEDYIKENGE